MRSWAGNVVFGALVLAGRRHHRHVAVELVRDDDAVTLHVTRHPDRRALDPVLTGVERARG